MPGEPCCAANRPTGNISTYTALGDLITVNNPATLGHVTMTYNVAGREKSLRVVLSQDRTRQSPIPLRDL